VSPALLIGGNKSSKLGRDLNDSFVKYEAVEPDDPSKKRLVGLRRIPPPSCPTTAQGTDALLPVALLVTVEVKEIHVPP